MKRLAYISWLSLALSLALFGAVYYEATSIAQDTATRADLASQAEQQLDKSAYAQRLHALVSDTADERAALDTFASSDVVSMVQSLQAAGKSAGVNASVLNAIADGPGTQLPGGGTLQPIAFSLSADGSFAQIIHAVEFYEHLPLASQVLQLGIERGDKNIWHLSLRIRISSITTNSI